MITLALLAWLIISLIATVAIYTSCVVAKRVDEQYGYEDAMDEAPESGQVVVI